MSSGAKQWRLECPHKEGPPSDWSMHSQVSSNNVGYFPKEDRVASDISQSDLESWLAQADASSMLLPSATVGSSSVKGQEWYQEHEIAEAYDDKRFSQGGRFIDRREKEAVLDALEPLEDRRVLEVACGTGRFTVMLAERGADVVGMDISEAMLEQGRTKAHAAGVEENLEFMQGDASRLPFPDDNFDAVFAMRFFHLAPDPEGFVREMRRVTRDQVFFDTFNRYSFRSIYNWALPMGSRLYSDREARELIVGADLELVDVAHDFVFPYGLYRQLPGWLARPIRNADTAIGRTPIGDRVASVSYWDARVHGPP